MDIIAKVTCNDCGNFIVSGANRIALFAMKVKGKGPAFTIATACQFCDQPVIEEVSLEVAQKIAERGVSVFSWHDGKKHEKVNY